MSHSKEDLMFINIVDDETEKSVTKEEQVKLIAEKKRKKLLLKNT